MLVRPCPSILVMLVEVGVKRYDPPPYDLCPRGVTMDDVILSAEEGGTLF